MTTKLTSKFIMTRDINGYNSFGLPFTDTAYQVVLGANSDTTLSVPSVDGFGNQGQPAGTNGQWLAIFNFQPGSSIWVNINATAVAPSSGSFVANTSQLNPLARVCQGGDVLHFISTTATQTVCVMFYSLT